MRIEVPFRDNDPELVTLDTMFDLEKKTPTGVYPIGQNKLWHTAIHLKTDSDNVFLRPLMDGEIVAYRVCNTYQKYDIKMVTGEVSTSFVLMKHKFFNGSKEIPFYILYSNLASLEKIKENEIKKTFFREWKLNRDCIAMSPLKKMTYFSDSRYTNSKGYLSRDGRYVIYTTTFGKQFYHTDKKYYFVNIPEKGFEKKSDYTILARKAHIPATERDKVKVYYDKERKYEKLSYDRTKIKNVKVDKRSTTEEAVIKFHSSGDFTYSSFVKQKFYIICEGSLEYCNQIINGTGNIKYYSRTKFKKETGKTGSSKYDATSRVQDIQLFVGDKVTVKEIDTAYEIGAKVSYKQYEIERVGTGLDLEGSQQRGFIGETSDKLEYLFTTVSIHELRNTVLQGSSNTHLTEKNGFMLYDTTGLVGTTVCFENELGAEIYVDRVEEKNQNTYALTRWGDKCGYLKCKEGKAITDIITPSNIAGFSTDTIICPTAEDNKKFVYKYIGMLDKSLPLCDIHIELFFCSLDDFTFKKTLTEQQKKDNVNTRIDIAKTDALLVCTNERIGFNPVQSDNKKTVIRLESLNQKSVFGSVNIETYEKVTIIAIKKWRTIQTKTINDNEDEDYILSITERDKDTNTGVVSFTKSKNPKNINTGCAIDLKERYNAEILETSKNTFIINVWLKTNSARETVYMFYRDIGSSFDGLQADNVYLLSSSCKLYAAEDLTFSSVKDLNKTVSVTEKTLTYRDCDFYNGTYIRIRLGDEYYFVKEELLTDCTIATEVEKIDEAEIIRYNVLDLPRFILMEDTNDDIVCDINAVLNKVEYDTTEGIDNPVKKIYEDSTLYKSVNQLVIKGPSMWTEKKDLKKEDLPKYGYIGLEPKEAEKTVEYLKGQFWLNDTVKKGSGITGSSFYYFHPVNFLNFVASKMTQEYNPYLGKEIAVAPSDSHGGMTSCVVSNPGFAPVSKFPTEYYSFVNGKKEYYATISGLFNENYTCVGTYWTKNIDFYHEGVDFNAAADTEVKSFIFAEVIAYGWFGAYGRTIFLKKTNGKGVFLIAHLSSYAAGIKVGMKVAPGDVIAKAGASGNGVDDAWNAHLHVTYFDWEYNERRKIVERSGTDIQKLAPYYEMYDKNNCNPFKYSEAKKANDPITK